MSDLAIKERSSAAPSVQAPTPDEVVSVLRDKYGGPETTGPAPRLWYRYGYATPDEYYEALVAKLVFDGCHWLDVGCGRNIFPHNRSLAETLAARCGFLMGVDPDPTLDDNTLVNEKCRTTIEELTTERQFDLVTLRMVAEHIAEPQRAAAALARLIKPGGRVVVYTVSRWSPLALAASIVPFKLHNPLKWLVWRTAAEDTFPVCYRMNTRRSLSDLFSSAGFHESLFDYLGDCRLFYRFQPLHWLELAGWRVCRALHVNYPENCILAVYERA